MRDIEGFIDKDAPVGARLVYRYFGYDVPMNAELQCRLNKGGSTGPVVFMNLDEMFDWIMKERATMSERLFRIEVRADILDDETYVKFKSLICHVGREAFAHANLLNQSPVKPQIAIITNDGFIGQKDIELFADLMKPDMEVAAVDTQEEPVSNELLQAMAGRQAEKNK